MGRECGDGTMCFVIRELGVAPAFRNQGIGTALMACLLDYVKSCLKPGMKACVELLSVRSKEDFYARFGFRARPSTDQGAGRPLIVEK